MASDDKKRKDQVSCQVWQSTYSEMSEMMENYEKNTGIKITRIAMFEKMRQMTLTYGKRFRKPKGKK